VLGARVVTQNQAVKMTVNAGLVIFPWLLVILSFPFKSFVTILIIFLIRKFLYTFLSASNEL
jgi:hypothetical protein